PAPGPPADLRSGAYSALVGKARPIELSHWEIAMDSAAFDALEHQARAQLPPSSFAFCAAGADAEITAAENSARRRALRLRPPLRRAVAQVDPGVMILGRHAAPPIMIAPPGRHRLFHGDGETAPAGGAAAAAAIFVRAPNATATIEEVAAARGDAA